MRVLPLALLCAATSLLAGCSAAPAPKTLLDETITVPPGEFGYVEMTLDEGQRVDWRWETSVIAGYWAGMGCPGASPDDREGADLHGRGHFSADRHGCTVLMFWRDRAEPYDVQVTLSGDGRILRHGTDDKSTFGR